MIIRFNVIFSIIGILTILFPNVFLPVTLLIAFLLLVFRESSDNVISEKPNDKALWQSEHNWFVRYAVILLGVALIAFFFLPS